ncbi:hypothetical protein HYU12_03415 [Candidatus Woesearchaeota archaeon]|nr:hypothetical protein [Candidatus Woesearchaeota archaeon]
MQVIINQDILIAEDVRLVKRLFKVGKDANFPDGLKFAYQYLVFKGGEWRMFVALTEGNRGG